VGGKNVSGFVDILVQAESEQCRYSGRGEPRPYKGKRMATSRRKAAPHSRYGYARPYEAKRTIAVTPSPEPRTAPARTSLRKCMPRTTRETAMLAATK
jgi:hypothetical protein